MEETIIISLGGSLIVPEEIDIEFLKSFKTLILEYVLKGKRFIIDTGGGRTCRKYQNAAREIVDASKEDLDWIGLTVNNVNAQLVRVIFGKDACEKVFYDLNDKELKEKIIQYPVVIVETGVPGVLLMIAAIGWWARASVCAWRLNVEETNALPKLGSAVLLLVFIASMFDYPARTPMILAIIIVAGVWLGESTEERLGPALLDATHTV